MLSHRQLRLFATLGFLTALAMCLLGLRLGFYPASLAGMGALIGLAIALVFFNRRGVVALAILGAVILPCATRPLWFDVWFDGHFSGAERIFRLELPSGYLQETLALETARKAIALDGYEPDDWEAVKSGLTKSPEGLADTYLHRGGNNPNRGHILFENSQTQERRMVSIEIEGDCLHAQVYMPK